MGWTKYYLMQYDSLGTTGVAKRTCNNSKGDVKTYYHRNGTWHLAPGFYDRKSIVREITLLEAMMEIL
jgi:hypothetical protein|tara:strand:- start:4648 stop:4851 length:204 start_codon:yes stop_codon:yes gene_type:complete